MPTTPNALTNKPSTLRPIPRSLPRNGPYTIADWVASERTSPTKYELHNGELVERNGGPFEHNAICANILQTFANLLEEAGVDCTVLGSDQKVFVRENKGYYPDVVFVCGSPQIDFEEALRNPVAIVEVLSESTAAFDRGDKFRDYRTIESLCYYLLVDQYRPSVECYERSEDGSWPLREYTNLTDSLPLTLSGVTVSLPLARIYRRVPLAVIDAE